jgi:hypothetical protein
MYLAGLIAVDARMTREDLQRWVERAGPGLVGATVPWVAAGSPHGRDVALAWLESPIEHIAAAGWHTLASLVSITPDSELDLAGLARLLERVQRTIHQQPNDVRGAMNGFVIALGSYVAPLTESAIAAGERIGRVTVDMGNNACQVPYAPDYIRKVQERGSIGKKRKSAKC